MGLPGLGVGGVSGASSAAGADSEVAQADTSSVISRDSAYRAAALAHALNGTRYSAGPGRHAAGASSVLVDAGATADEDEDFARLALIREQGSDAERGATGFAALSAAERGAFEEAATGRLPRLPRRRPTSGRPGREEGRLAWTRRGAAARGDDYDEEDDEEASQAAQAGGAGWSEWSDAGSQSGGHSLRNRHNISGRSSHVRGDSDVCGSTVGGHSASSTLGQAAHIDDSHVDVTGHDDDRDDDEDGEDDDVDVISRHRSRRDFSSRLSVAAQLAPEDEAARDAEEGDDVEDQEDEEDEHRAVDGSADHEDGGGNPIGGHQTPASRAGRGCGAAGEAGRIVEDAAAPSAASGGIAGAVGPSVSDEFRAAGAGRGRSALRGAVASRLERGAGRGSGGGRPASASKIGGAYSVGAPDVEGGASRPDDDSDDDMRGLTPGSDGGGRVAATAAASGDAEAVLHTSVGHRPAGARPGHTHEGTTSTSAAPSWASVASVAQLTAGATSAADTHGADSTRAANRRSQIYSSLSTRAVKEGGADDDEDEDEDDAGHDEEDGEEGGPSQFAGLEVGGAPDEEGEAELGQYHRDGDHDCDNGDDDAGAADGAGTPGAGADGEPAGEQGDLLGRGGDASSGRASFVAVRQEAVAARLGRSARGRNEDASTAAGSVAEARISGAGAGSASDTPAAARGPSGGAGVLCRGAGSDSACMPSASSSAAFEPVAGEGAVLPGSAPQVPYARSAHGHLDDDDDHGSHVEVASVEVRPPTPTLEPQLAPGDAGPGQGRQGEGDQARVPLPGAGMSETGVPALSVGGLAPIEEADAGSNPLMLGSRLPGRLHRGVASGFGSAASAGSYRSDAATFAGAASTGGGGGHSDAAGQRMDAQAARRQPLGFNGAGEAEEDDFPDTSEDDEDEDDHLDDDEDEEDDDDDEDEDEDVDEGGRGSGHEAMGTAQLGGAASNASTGEQTRTPGSLLGASLALAGQADKAERRESCGTRSTEGANAQRASSAGQDGAESDGAGAASTRVVAGGRRGSRRRRKAKRATSVTFALDTDTPDSPHHEPHISPAASRHPPPALGMAIDPLGGAGSGMPVQASGRPRDGADVSSPRRHHRPNRFGWRASASGHATSAAVLARAAARDLGEAEAMEALLDAEADAGDDVDADAPHSPVRGAVASSADEDDDVDGQVRQRRRRRTADALEVRATSPLTVQAAALVASRRRGWEDDTGSATAPYSDALRSPTQTSRQTEAPQSAPARGGSRARPRTAARGGRPGYGGVRLAEVDDTTDDLVRLPPPWEERALRTTARPIPSSRLQRALRHRDAGHEITALERQRLRVELDAEIPDLDGDAGPASRLADMWADQA